MQLQNVVADREGVVGIRDIGKLKDMMDILIHEAGFSEDEMKTALLLLVKEIAKAAGAIPSSIQCNTGADGIQTILIAVP